MKDMVRQRDAEKARERSKQFLQWISETAKIGGWEMDIVKNSIFWSEEICKIREIDNCSETSLDNAFSFYPPEARSIIEKAVEEGVKNGISWDVELPIITAKGNKKWVRDIGIPEIKDGKCIGLRGVMQDITNTKNAILAVQKHEQQLELAIKAGNLATWSFNITTGEMVFDTQWTSLLGYSAEETDFHFSTWERLLHPDDKDYVNEVLHKHLSGKAEHYVAEYRLKHKEGHWVWVLDQGKVIERDAMGKPVVMRGIYMNITERRITEFHNSSLQVELEQFKSAVSAASIVSVTNLNGIITYVNANFEEISQYSRQELIGSSHNIINSGYHPKAFWANMWQTVVKGKIWLNEVKNKRKDGTYYWVDTFIIPLKNSNNQIIEYLSIRNDITQKKEMELRLREALTKAEESDRLKSAFLANISHEIRTPMNAIMGFSELLERPGITREKKLEFTQHLRLRCQDLLSMIDDILYMSRIQAGHLSISYLEGNIDELMDKLIFSIQSKNHYMNEKEIEFRKINMLDPSQYRVRLDFRGLFQVLSNLLSNALKFTNKGFIELTCRMESANVLEFVVKDTGIGIDNEKLKDVFKLFRQADHAIHEHYGGSGLGLSVCKGLVELWGGKMWAESTVNEGSAFYFTVPFVR